MHTTNLRKVGGSVMLAVPPSILDLLHLTAGSTVGVTVEKGRLIIEPQRKRRYTLDELLAQCDPAGPITDEERQWLEAPPKGDEII